MSWRKNIPKILSFREGKIKQNIIQLNSRLNKKQKFASGSIAGVFAFFAIAPLVFAAQSINYVSLNNGTNWTNSSNGQVVYIKDTSYSNRDFDAKINVTLTNNDDWKCTTTKIEGENTQTHNTTDATTNGTHSREVSLLAPDHNGKYDITFRIYESGSSSCSGDYKEFKISNAVVVDTVDPSNPDYLHSTSHDINEPNKDKTIDMAWPGIGSHNGASDSTSGVDGYSYSFTSHSNSSAPSTKSLDASATSVTSSNLADGTYYFHFRTFDKAGNSSSTIHKGPYVIDTTAPSVPGSLSFEYGWDNLGCSSSNYTNHGTLKADWNGVHDADHYEISLNDGWPFDVNSSHYNWNLPDSDGTHSFKVRAVDSAGNKSNYSSTCSITLDQTNPEVSAGSNVSASGEFTKEDATASDATSGIASYSWAQESGPEDGTVTVTSPDQLNPSFSADKDGTYVLRLTVTDNAGNSSYSEFTLLWDATPAIVSFDAVPSLSSNDTTPTFEFSATDNISSPENITYECKLNDGEFEECTSPVTLELSQGEYTFSVRATDELGNEETASYTWFIDTTPPVITIQGSSPAVMSVGSIYNDAGATASDNHDGNITEDIVATGSVNTSAPGTYQITYNVSDSAGNAATPVKRTVVVTDNDGSSDETENNAPNGGDANNDGTPDSQQISVTSFVNTVTESYAVLENSNDCENNSVNVVPSSSLAAQDDGFDYPAGMMKFVLECGEDNVGITTTVTQYYYGVDASNLVARKYNDVTNTYEAIPGATIEQTTIDGQTVAKMTYQITDGGQLDEDGVANGTIVDPSGLAQQVVGAPNTGIGSGTPTAILSVFIMAGLAAFYRPKFPYSL